MFFDKFDKIDFFAHYIKYDINMLFNNFKQLKKYFKKNKI
jgi:hypothetical protein